MPDLAPEQYDYLRSRLAEWKTHYDAAAARVARSSPQVQAAYREQVAVAAIGFDARG